MRKVSDTLFIFEGVWEGPPPPAPPEFELICEGKTYILYREKEPTPSNVDTGPDVPGGGAA